MTLIKDAVLVLIGLASGATVASGVFAFITMIGVVPRLAARTGTANHVHLYEDIIVIAGTLGNLFYIFQWRAPIGEFGMIIMGVASGVFVGCLALALAEVLQVIPILVRKIDLTKGISFIILCLAIGKAVGSFYQLVIRAK